MYKMSVFAALSRGFANFSCKKPPSSTFLDLWGNKTGRQIGLPKA
jgi:hypothetical protein